MKINNIFKRIIEGPFSKLYERYSDDHFLFIVSVQVKYNIAGKQESGVVNYYISAPYVEVE